MGQKINPIGFRLGINRTWDSRWFADNAEYGQLLHEDLKMRKFVMSELKQAGISKVVIERPHKKCRVTIHSARPGLIIGRKGADIDKSPSLKQEMQTTARLPLGKKIIVGGMTLDPSDPAQSGRQLYLVVEVDAGK